MDPIEKAIRSAFEKGDAEDEAFRDRIYRSAFAALERALKANPNLTVETAIKRRKSLEEKIATIELDFQPAIPAVEMEAPAATRAPAAPTDPEINMDVSDSSSGPDAEPQLAPGLRNAPHPGVSPEPRASASGPAAGMALEAPTISMDRPLAGTGGPQAGAPAVDTLDAPIPSDRPSKPRGRPLVGIFIAVVLLSALAIGIGWAIQTGLIKVPGQVADDAPPSQAATESEDFIPEAEDAPGRPGAADPQRNWIAVFEPTAATAVTAPADAKAEVMQDESGSFLRVRSGKSGSAVIFDVGQGVLERLAGKKATFDIVARAEPETETEMMVDCNFGELGDCGRKRYSVGRDKGDYLFDLEMPKASPGSGGTIAINSDFANGGNAVDIYAIRVSVSE